MYEFEIENTKQAIAYWVTVAPETVIKRLHYFRLGGRRGEAPSCGSPACFGGHLPYAPYFARLGVKTSLIGGPRLNGVFGRDISEYLFGSQFMFSCRSVSERGTDHAVVTKRLKTNLIRLQAAK